MYSITLEINQKCNLSCRYCYLGDKDKSEMPYEVALQCIDLAFENTKIHRDKTLWVDFIGGEPLLDFEYIKKIVDYIYTKNKNNHYTLIFSITTNGTIMDDEKIDWLTDNNFLLKISIDGKKEIHDLNRISKNGISTFDQICANWHYFKKYEEISGKRIQVTNVITKNNYSSYYDTFKFLVEEMKIRVIDTAIDLYTEWTKEDLHVLEIQMNKTVDYYLDTLRKKLGIYWSFVKEVSECNEEKKKFYCCGAGIISLYVRTTGQFYTCPTCLDEKGCIGDIYNGFDWEKIHMLKNFNDINNANCQKCDLYKKCKANSCLMFSLFSNNDVNIPNKTLCWLEIYKHKLFDRKKQVLERIQWN